MLEPIKRGKKSHYPLQDGFVAKQQRDLQGEANEKRKKASST